MTKNSEKINWDRIEERSIIDLFLSYHGITDKPSYAQNSDDFDFPDCIVPNVKLCIEVASVRVYDITRTVSKSAGEKSLELKFHDKRTQVAINRILDEINKKQNKPSYRELPSRYKNRILLVSVNGRGLDWRKDFDAILRKDNFLNLQSKIFNAIYLVIYPVHPTKYDIDNKIFPDKLPHISNFVRIL